MRGLPDSPGKIVAALRQADRLSTGEVVELLGVSRPVAQRELGALREAELIERVGKSARDPRAYWRLKPTLPRRCYLQLLETRLEPGS